MNDTTTRPWRLNSIVVGSNTDIAAANAAGFKLEPHTWTDHQLVETLIYTGDDKIDLAYGFRILMEKAGSYPSYEMVGAILSGPADMRLDYDGVISCDKRYDGCNDPRVILRELMKMFGDEQIRDLVNERIGAVRPGTTTTLEELNAKSEPEMESYMARHRKPQTEAEIEARRQANHEEYRADVLAGRTPKPWQQPPGETPPQPAGRKPWQRAPWE